MANEDYKPDGGFIETASGKHFHIAEPAFDINDIAHALGMKVRYGGHCLRFYSVAEHSVLVSRICEQECLADPFEGLMHDAHEAYIGDMPSPIKHVLPDFKRLEQRLEHALRDQWALPAAMTPGCKRADLLALYLEAHTLLPSGGDALFGTDVDGLREYAQAQFIWSPECLSPDEAKLSFLTRYQELK
jgi:hypothetical protein